MRTLLVSMIAIAVLIVPAAGKDTSVESKIRIGILDLQPFGDAQKSTEQANATLVGLINDIGFYDVYTQKKLEIEGQADSASGLITLLEDSPLFNDVAFQSAITKTKEGKERFNIVMKVTGAERR